MNDFDRKAHWEHIYQTKQLEDVGWFQPKPETSLDFFNELNVQQNERIIDVGGGDSFLVDHLLDMGYLDVTVLDISSAAIERAKKRLGDNANKVKWIVGDILDLDIENSFDFWHDRAAFHFLTETSDIQKYSNLVNVSLQPNGRMVIGTFSENGPRKCSGIRIKQYSEQSILETFGTNLQKIKCIRIDHQTPSNTIQNFLFCSFRKT